MESQVAAAELLLVRARNLAAVCETQLRTLMHDDSREAYQSQEDLAAAVAPDLPEARTEELLWSETAGKRLELSALDETAGELQRRCQPPTLRTHSFSVTSVPPCSNSGSSSLLRLRLFGGWQPGGSREGSAGPAWHCGDQFRLSA